MGRPHTSARTSGPRRAGNASNHRIKRFQQAFSRACSALSYAIEPVKTNRRAYGQFSACTGALISGRRRNRRVHYAAARVTGGIPCRPAPIVSDLANRDRSYVARRCDRCGRCDGHRLRGCCRSCCAHHNRARHESGRRRPAVPVRVGTVVTVVVVLHVGNCRSTRVLHFLCAGLGGYSGFALHRVSKPVERGLDHDTCDKERRTFRKSPASAFRSLAVTFHCPFDENRSRGMLPPRSAGKLRAFWHRLSESLRFECGARLRRSLERRGVAQSPFDLHAAIANLIDDVGAMQHAR